MKNVSLCVLALLLIFLGEYRAFGAEAKEGEGREPADAALSDSSGGEDGWELEDLFGAVGEDAAAEAAAAAPPKTSHPPLHSSPPAACGRRIAGSSLLAVPAARASSDPAFPGDRVPPVGKTQRGLLPGNANIRGLPQKPGGRVMRFDRAVAITRLGRTAAAARELMAAAAGPSGLLLRGHSEGIAAAPTSRNASQAAGLAAPDSGGGAAPELARGLSVDTQVTNSSGATPCERFYRIQARCHAHLNLDYRRVARAVREACEPGSLCFTELKAEIGTAADAAAASFSAVTSLSGSGVVLYKVLREFCRYTKITGATGPSILRDVHAHFHEDVIALCSASASPPEDPAVHLRQRVLGIYLLRKAGVSLESLSLKVIQAFSLDASDPALEGLEPFMATDDDGSRSIILPHNGYILDGQFFWYDCTSAIYAAYRKFLGELPAGVRFDTGLLKAFVHSTQGGAAPPVELPFDVVADHRDIKARDILFWRYGDEEAGEAAAATTLEEEAARRGGHGMLVVDVEVNLAGETIVSFEEAKNFTGGFRVRRVRLQDILEGNIAGAGGLEYHILRPQAGLIPAGADLTALPAASSSSLLAAAVAMVSVPGDPDAANLGLEAAFGLLGDRRATPEEGPGVAGPGLGLGLDLAADEALAAVEGLSPPAATAMAAPLGGLRRFSSGDTDDTEDMGREEPHHLQEESTRSLATAAEGGEGTDRTGDGDGEEFDLSVEDVPEAAAVAAAAVAANADDE